MSLDVLITGGSGYLGQFLLQALAQERHLSPAATGAPPVGGGNGDTGGNGCDADATVQPPPPAHPPLIGRLAYTYLANPLPEEVTPAPGFKVDLDADDGGRAALTAAFEQGLGLGADQGAPGRARRTVVVNCVAISTPATCERDYERALRINVPSALTDAARAAAAAARAREGDDDDDSEDVPAILHVSTDQVYPGEGRGAWREGVDPPQPANAYGRSKLQAERHLAARWPRGRHASLRASLIYGPQSPLAPVPRPLFVQFCARVAREGEPVTFFEDEWRSAVLVDDVVAVALRMLRGIAREADRREAAVAAGAAAADAAAAAAAPCSSSSPAGADADDPRPACPWPLPLPAYNMGGPERLSRVDMARLVARAALLPTGEDDDAAVERAVARAVVPAPSASVPADKRGYESPRDISMDPSALLRDLGAGLRLTRMRDALPGVLMVGAEEDSGAEGGKNA